MAKLVLIDSFAILHRAYHALPTMNFKRGDQLINAVYGFFSMLIRAVVELKPDYLAACFDTFTPSFRKEKFIAYQANRLETDGELVSQIKLTRDSLAGTGIPVLAKTGFEADDVIGTIVKKVNSLTGKKDKKLTIIIVTGDKDLMQLVGKDVNLFLLTRGVSETILIGPSQVKENLGVEAGQVVDYKALVGDSSDNYPGVSGIGPKGAASLLKQFRSLGEIYQSLPKIDQKIREKLKADKESAFLSYELAKIRRDIPINFFLKDAKWDESKLLRLKSVIAELRFPSLIKRMEKRFSKKAKEQQMKLI